MLSFWLSPVWLVADVMTLAPAQAAQPPGEFITRSFGAADGLNASTLYAVAAGPPDGPGGLYLGTGDGLYHFDGQHFIEIQRPEGTARQPVLALAVYGAQGKADDTLWAFSGEWLLRMEAGRLVKVAEIGPQKGVVAGMSRGPEGDLWLAAESGLWRLRGEGPDQGRVIAVVRKEGWEPRAVLADANGAWVGTKEGLYRVEDGNVRRVRDGAVRVLAAEPEGVLVGQEDGVFDIPGAPLAEGAACFVTAMARLPDGRRVLGCGSGVRIADREGGWESLTDKNGLPGQIVRGVAVDRDGLLWVAVWRGGLVRVADPDIRLWRGPDLAIAPVSDVQAAGAPGRAGPWLTVAGWEGAWRIGPDMRRRRMPEPTGGDHRRLRYSPDGSFWAGAPSGIWRLAPGAAAYVRVDDRDPLMGLEVLPDGTVWAAGPDGLFHPGGPAIPLPPDTVDMSMAADAAGALRILGIRRWWSVEPDEGAPGGSRIVDRGPAPCEGVGSARMAGSYVLCEDSVMRWDGEQWARIFEMEPDELPRAISAAPNGSQIWVSTSRRLLRLAPGWAAFDAGEGLPGVNFGAGATLAVFGGWVAAGVADGLLWIRPSVLEREPEVPEAIIRGLELRGQLVDPSLLGPEDDFLRLRFGTGWMGDPAQVRYRLRIDDSLWSEPQREDGVHLPGLEPGAHTAEVQARVAGGPWSAPAGIRFTLPPRWWERDSVRLGGLMSLIIAIILWYRARDLRLRQLLQSAQELERVRQTFGRFVTPVVAEAALAGRLRAEGERREVTVLFVDIQGFTPLTARTEPHRLVELLNLWLSSMIAAIEAEGGVVNKFLGDAMVAVFGAPHDQPDHPDAAVRAAVRMIQAAGPLNRTLQVRFGCELGFGIGINTGSVIAGPVGAASRMEYTVIGEPVNIAARVEALTRTLGSRILLTEATRACLRQPFDLQPRGTHRLKGVEGEVKVWEALS